MLQHNDSHAVSNKYESYLLQQKVPRQFWRHFVRDIDFLPVQIDRGVEGTKKLRTIFAATPEQQLGYWTNLLTLVSNWDPSGKDSPDAHFALFCCENLRDAQFCLFTMTHFMLASLFTQRRRYKLQVVRNYELYKLLDYSEILDAPNVVMFPNLIPEMTRDQISNLTDLFSSCYRMFAATTMGPQKFFEKFNYLPHYVFYVDKIKMLGQIDPAAYGK